MPNQNIINDTTLVLLAMQMGAEYRGYHEAMQKMLKVVYETADAVEHSFAQEAMFNFAQLMLERLPEWDALVDTAAEAQSMHTRTIQELAKQWAEDARTCMDAASTASATTYGWNSLSSLVNAAHNGGSVYAH